MTKPQSDYLLDTQILDYWYNDRYDEHPNVIMNVKAVQQPDPQNKNHVSRLFVSPVTIGEITYGHLTAPGRDLDLVKAQHAEFSRFVREQCPESLEITRHVAENYGRMKAWLFNEYSPKSERTPEKRSRQLSRPISAVLLQAHENDLWIAAQAMTEGLVLVTHDSGGHFGDVLKQFQNELTVVDWAKA